jgi:hypothetical protein
MMSRVSSGYGVIGIIACRKAPDRMERGARLYLIQGENRRQAAEERVGKSCFACRFFQDLTPR